MSEDYENISADKLIKIRLEERRSTLIEIVEELDEIVEEFNDSTFNGAFHLGKLYKRLSDECISWKF